MPVLVFVDASQFAVDTVIKQPDLSNTLHPVAFRALRNYEKKL